MLHAQNIGSHSFDHSRRVAVASRSRAAYLPSMGAAVSPSAQIAENKVLRLSIKG